MPRWHSLGGGDSPNPINTQQSQQGWLLYSTFQLIKFAPKNPGKLPSSTDLSSLWKFLWISLDSKWMIHQGWRGSTKLLFVEDPVILSVFYWMELFGIWGPEDIGRHLPTIISYEVVVFFSNIFDIFSPIPGEMIQFWRNIFQMGWKHHISWYIILAASTFQPVWGQNKWCLISRISTT